MFGQNGYPFLFNILLFVSELWLLYVKGIFKILNNSSPGYTNEIYQTADETSFTHRSLIRLHPPTRRTKKGQKCVSYIGPKLWNNLPKELKTIKNVNTFKHQIKNNFFKDLQTEKRRGCIHILLI